MTYPACRGDCGQGARPCPNPHKCQDDGLDVFRGPLIAIAITLAGVAVASLIAWMIS